MQNIPYTYLIKFTNPKTNEEQFYYGSRYAHDCHPDDLFKTYFTSSKIIKDLIEQFGVECFHWEIRKTFNDAKTCQIYETKILNRLNVRHNKKWINLNCNSILPPLKKSEATKKKMSESAKQSWKNNPNRKTSFYYNNPSKKGITKDRKHIHNPITFEHKFVKKEKINEYLNKGWVAGFHESRKIKLRVERPERRGIPKTEDQKKKISETKRRKWLNGDYNHIKPSKRIMGKIHSEETKIKISESNKLFFKDNPGFAKERALKSITPERNKKISNSKNGCRKMIKGNLEKIVMKKDFKTYLDEGWSFRRNLLE